LQNLGERTPPRKEKVSLEERRPPAISSPERIEIPKKEVLHSGGTMRRKKTTGYKIERGSNDIRGRKNRNGVGSEVGRS